jgi:hypothetical protein
VRSAVPNCSGGGSRSEWRACLLIETCRGTALTILIQLYPNGLPNNKVTVVTWDGGQPPQRVRAWRKRLRMLMTSLAFHGTRAGSGIRLAVVTGRVIALICHARVTIGVHMLANPQQPADDEALGDASRSSFDKMDSGRRFSARALHAYAVR